VDPLAMLDAEETRLLTQLAEVRTAKSTLRRVCGLTDPPHGPIGTPGDLRGPVATAPPAGCVADLPREPAPPPPAEETPPGKPTPRPATHRGGDRGLSQVDERRQRIRDLLATAGSMRNSEISERLNIPQGSLGKLLGHEWFEKTPGPDSVMTRPWALTEAGRAAATAPTSSAT
jgi:hypothetical protein